MVATKVALVLTAVLVVARAGPVQVGALAKPIKDLMVVQERVAMIAVAAVAAQDKMDKPAKAILAVLAALAFLRLFLALLCIMLVAAAAAVLGQLAELVALVAMAVAVQAVQHMALTEQQTLVVAAAAGVVLDKPTQATAVQESLLSDTQSNKGAR
jgi:hypothetical protein